MPVPSPRNSIRIARGDITDLLANATAFGDGEIIYAIDEDRFYTSDAGTLFPVGAGVLALNSINALGDVDTSTVAPGIGSALKWDGTNWVPGTDEDNDAVTSVNGETGAVVLSTDDIDDTAATNKYTTQSDIDKLATVEQGAEANTVTSVAAKTGDVVLVKADVTNFDDADYATAAQGLLADSSTQPGDGVSTLSNDANYITLGDVPGDAVISVQGRTGAVVISTTDLSLNNVDNTSDADKPVSTATQAALDGKADLVGGVVPTSQIPAIAITEFLGDVASQAAMLALSGQEGDWCNRTDLGQSFVITGTDPTQLSSWTDLVYPAAPVTSVNGQAGTVVLGATDVGAVAVTGGNMTGDLTLGTDKINLDASSGSAEFAGDVEIGGGNIELASDGGYTGTRSVTVNRTSNNNPLFVGNLNGVETFKVLARGSADFAGKVEAGGGNIELNSDGSAVFTGNITAGNVSDIRFKKNIADARPQLSDVVTLGSQLKNWDWSDDAPLDGELKAKRFIGVIAQEAEKVCPGLTYVVARTKDGRELTPEVIEPAVYETREVNVEGEVKLERVLVTREEVTPATYEQLDDSYKAINHDILVMKLLGAVAELTARVEELESSS